MKQEASIGKDFGEGRTASKESQSVEQRPPSEIERTALDSISTYRKYQRTSVAKQAARTSVLEMVIHFRLSKTSWRNFSITETMEESGR